MEKKLPRIKALLTPGEVAEPGRCGGIGAAFL